MGKVIAGVTAGLALIRRLLRQEQMGRSGLKYPSKKDADAAIVEWKRTHQGEPPMSLLVARYGREASRLTRIADKAKASLSPEDLALVREVQLAQKGSIAPYLGKRYGFPKSTRAKFEDAGGPSDVTYRKGGTAKRKPSKASKGSTAKRKKK